jgi:CubicO group peptidase (beta-lactamase class C family)
MSDKVLLILNEAIKSKLFPGAVVGVVNKDGKRLIISAGRFTYEADSPMVKEDSIYDVASVTKVIPTSSLALQLIDEGKLAAEDKLIKFIPEFNNSDRDKVKIEHLLTQTLDFNLKLSSLKNKKPEEILRKIYTTDFNSPPGKRFFYHNATIVLLGIIIEIIAGETLDRLAQKRFFNPLEMKKTMFKPLEKFRKQEIVPSEIDDDWRKRVIQGEVHDESAFAFRSEMITGHAGLFTTVPDLLNFMEMLLNGGVMNGRKYFSEEMIRNMETNLIPETGASHGWGWEVSTPRYMGNLCGKNTFAKTGFTGCVVMADRKKQEAFVMLSNCKYPHRTENIDMLNVTRARIADIVWSERL